MTFDIGFENCGNGFNFALIACCPLDSGQTEVVINKHNRSIANWVLYLLCFFYISKQIYRFWKWRVSM